MLQNVFRWFSGVFFGDILVPADNIFQEWFGSGVSHDAVDCVLARVQGWIIEEIVSVRRGWRYIRGEARFGSRARLALVRQRSR